MKGHVVQINACPVGSASEALVSVNLRIFVARPPPQLPVSLFCQATSASTVADRRKPSLNAYPSDSKPPPCVPLPGAVKIKPRTGWRAVPQVPKFLGLAGLLPFFALCPPILKASATWLASVDALQPVASVLLHEVLPITGLLQIGYGTAVVSFLGAVHWGSAMQSRTGHTTKLMFERYIWSVMPALVVFPAAAAGEKAGSVIVLSALLATFAIDAKFNWKGALPKWYMALRVPITIGAAGAMLITVWHAQAEEQAMLDYEAAVSEMPSTAYPEPQAVVIR
jgi:hypothetical protein